MNKIKGKRVIVKLNDGAVYTGNFICMDGNLNVVLETVELYESLELAESRSAANREEFSDVFIRGNNVCYIAPASTSSVSKQDKQSKRKQKQKKAKEGAGGAAAE